MQPCSGSFQATLGLPCKHTCMAFLQGVRRRPFVLADFHPYWHIILETQLVDEAKEIGTYVPRIDPREVFDIIDEVEVVTAPVLANPYLLPPPEGNARETRLGTVLNPIPRAHVGRVSATATLPTDGSPGSLPRSQQPSITERMYGVGPAPAISQPVTSTERLQCRFERVEGKAPRKPPTCTVCGKLGHTKRNRDCQRANDARIAEIWNASQPSLAPITRTVEPQSSDETIPSTLDISGSSSNILVPATQASVATITANFDPLSFFNDPTGTSVFNDGVDLPSRETEEGLMFEDFPFDEENR